MSNHTLVTDALADFDKRAGYLLIEWVRGKIREHFQAHNEWPAEVALSLERFREFERYYPDWCADFNTQFSHLPPCQVMKNQQHHIIFGQTVVRPQV